ncbi:hypothetical protein HQ571_06040 [Candidatus Kuenenbacteria bacterium]|nr:hypothetical protein [Candidatus Kuenenbacteria bacterium]
MDFHNELKQIGLTKSEIVVYLYLLEGGISSPPQVSKGTKIARTNCYNILQSLKDKGLIQEQKKAKRNAYLAKDPTSLLSSLEKKKQSLQQVIPDLQALYTVQKNKPKITFYDGWDEVKEIYLKTLEAKEVYAIGSTKTLLELDEKFFNLYFQKLKQKNIVLHDIVSFGSENTALDESKKILKGFYDAKVLPVHKNEITTDILLWENNIAIISLQEPVFGTVLYNENVYSTFKIIFNSLFKLL